MILTSSTAPPPLRSSPLQTSTVCATTYRHATTLPIPATSPDAAPTRIETPIESVELPKEEEEQDFLERLKVPTVILNTPSISHTMAAALSLSLLGHTLFLKSQVPFPVAQLSRMPRGKSNPKVAKKRDELLATFDTLASHFHTTFVALSTAYAKCKHVKGDSARSGDENESEPPKPQPNGESRIPRRGAAHLMFILGPSATAARARIVLTIDGLEVKVWGARPIELSPHEEDEISEEAEYEVHSEEEDSEELESEASEGEQESDEEEPSSSDVSEDDGATDTESLCSGPPASRSPSPSTPPTRSLAPSPESLPSPPTLPMPLVAASATARFVLIDSPPTTSSTSSSVSQPHQGHPLVPLTQPPRRPTSRASSRSRQVSPELSYAEEQQALRAAERLLSRTLMNAWVDGEDDMSSELAPTQTHIFIRAPRRFVHPAWAARQNLTRTLNGVLDGFLQDAGAVPAPSSSGAKGKAKSKGVRTEGAWVGCRGGSAFAEKDAVKDGCGGERQAEKASEEDEEDNEEIWWAWEGKIIGFADW